MGWKQLTFGSTAEIKSSLSDLVTIVSRTRSGENKIIGTGFVLISSESNLLLVTAAHVVEHGYSESDRAMVGSRSTNLNHIPYNDNDPYIQIEKWVTETTDIWCLIIIGDEVINCPVIGSNLKPPLDMAFLVVDARPLNQVIPVFQINSDMLNVGDEVILTSFVTKDGVRDLVGRYGNITAIDSNGPLVNAPVYTTNIPIESGASGGPVFKYNGNFNGPKEVIGVVSSDFSVKESFHDTRIDGESRISIICSAAPLGVKHPERGEMTFKDLCLNGVIQDVGSYMEKLQLTVFPDGNWHQKFPK